GPAPLAFRGGAAVPPSRLPPPPAPPPRDPCVPAPLSQLRARRDIPLLLPAPLRVPRMRPPVRPRGAGVPGRRVHVQPDRGRAGLRRDPGERAPLHLARPAVGAPHLRRRGADGPAPGRALPVRED